MLSVRVAIAGADCARLAICPAGAGAADGAVALEGKLGETTVGGKAGEFVAVVRGATGLVALRAGRAAAVVAGASSTGAASTDDTGGASTGSGRTSVGAGSGAAMTGLLGRTITGSAVASCASAGMEGSTTDAAIARGGAQRASRLCVIMVTQRSKFSERSRNRRCSNFYLTVIAAFCCQVMR